MASNKKKQDEKHLKMLREMVALPSNKTCFDCHQRGPTYVNMTIGSFVCTSCSGILRGLNPPHRVKSISMASFTPEEMDFLKSHGNELNRKVYLGLYDNRTWPEPDSRDEQRVRDFMVQKYENKRFYVAPTEAMREEARRINDAALSKQPQTKPLRALLGENATRLVVGNSQTSTANQNNTIQSSAAAPSMATPQAKSSLPPPVTAQPQQPAKPAGGGFDLLGELGSDPFASSAPTSATASTGGFADFSNFGSAAVTAPAPAQPAVQSSAPSAFPPMSNAPLQPFGSSGAGLQPQPLSATPAGSAPPSSTPTQPSQTSFSAISDKYAALADLDCTFNTTSVQSTPTVNWGGSDSSAGSSLNWGGSDSGGGAGINWGGSSSTGSGDGGQLNWGGGSAGSGGLNWNSGGGGGVGGGATTMSGGVFGGAPSTVANPFGGTSVAGMPSGGAMPGHQANPFGTTTQPGGFGTPATAVGGFPQQPASSAGGFGFQQFPVQNGGFGMATTAGGFAPFSGAPPNTAPPSYGMAQQQGFQAQPGGAPGFPPQPGMGGGWGQMGGGAPQPSSANPFMSAATQQTMPPRGKSTNPFL